MKELQYVLEDPLKQMTKVNLKFSSLFKSKIVKESEAFQYLNEVKKSNKEILGAIHNDIKTGKKKIHDWSEVIYHQSSQLESLKKKINDLKAKKQATATLKFKTANGLSHFPSKSWSTSKLPDFSSSRPKKNIEFRGLTLSRNPDSVSTLPNSLSSKHSGLGEQKHISYKNANWDVINDQEDPRDMTWKSLSSYYNQRIEASVIGTESNHKATTELQQQNHLAKEKVINLDMKLRALKFKVASETFKSHGTISVLRSKLKIARTQLETVKLNRQVHSIKINAQITVASKELHCKTVQITFGDKISGQCLKRLKDRILSIDNNNETNVEHEIENQNKMIEIADAMLKRETFTLTDEQRILRQMVNQETSIDSTIEKVFVSISDMSRTTALNLGQCTSFNVDFETKEKIKFFNNQSRSFQRQISKTMRFFCCELLFWFQQMSKSPLFNCDDNIVYITDYVEKKESFPNIKRNSYNRKKKLLENLVYQRTEQKKELKLLQMNVLAFTKELRDNGDKNKTVLKSLRLQLRDSNSKFKNKDIIISALRLLEEGKRTT